MLTQILLVTAILAIASLPFIAWKIGRRFPTQAVREKIETETIDNTIIKWYGAGREWKCVDIIENHPGFMGIPTRVVVLENGNERIKFCYCNDIVKGTSVKLQPRKRHEPGVWVGAIDEVMRPVLCS